MSEKKRGFLGRLFSGKDKNETPEAEGIKPSAENPVVDAPQSEPEPADTGFDAAPDLTEPPAEPPIAEETLFTGIGAEEALEPDLSEGLSDTVEPETVVPETPVITPVTTDIPAETPPVVPDDQPKRSWFQKLKSGLSRSSSALTDGISSIFTKRKLDATMLEELEDVLIQADLGVDTAMAITDRLSQGRYNKEIEPEEVRAILSEEVEKVLEPVAHPLNLDTGRKPHVVLMVGVNGTGKTTTIGKLSQKLATEGKKVMLAAGDTFRAAAVEQLKIWGQRTGAEVIARDTGADAAGLAFDAMKEAKEKAVDVLLIDTAGRLQNKAELMDELEKVIRVIKKHDPEAPHTVLLTLDATTGQNALNQVEIFGKVAGVTGLVMTKLDGTARWWHPRRHRRQARDAGTFHRRRRGRRRSGTVLGQGFRQRDCRAGLNQSISRFSLGPAPSLPAPSRSLRTESPGRPYSLQGSMPRETAPAASRPEARCLAGADRRRDLCPGSGHPPPCHPY